ncbi:MAG: hypothetical protein VB878_22610, partial [Pirellulaceae bacterium]
MSCSTYRQRFFCLIAVILLLAGHRSATTIYGQAKDLAPTDAAQPADDEPDGSVPDQFLSGVR